MRRRELILGALGLGTGISISYLSRYVDRLQQFIEQNNTNLDQQIVQLSVCETHALALTANGRIIAWGDNSYQQLNIPRAFKYRYVHAINNVSIAVSTNGSVAIWGAKSATAETPIKFIPKAASQGVIQVTAAQIGEQHYLLNNNKIKQKGTFRGLIDSALSSKFPYNLWMLALKDDNSIVAWGNNSFGQQDIPIINEKITSITAFDHVPAAAALTESGNVYYWGAIDLLGIVDIVAETYHRNAYPTTGVQSINKSGILLRSGEIFSFAQYPHFIASKSNLKQFSLNIDKFADLIRPYYDHIALLDHNGVVHIHALTPPDQLQPEQAPMQQITSITSNSDYLFALNLNNQISITSFDSLDYTYETYTEYPDTFISVTGRHGVFGTTKRRFQRSNDLIRYATVFALSSDGTIHHWIYHRGKRYKSNFSLPPNLPKMIKIYVDNSLIALDEQGIVHIFKFDSFMDYLGHRTLSIPDNLIVDIVREDGVYNTPLFLITKTHQLYIIVNINDLNWNGKTKIDDDIKFLRKYPEAIKSISFASQSEKMIIVWGDNNLDILDTTKFNDILPLRLNTYNTYEKELIQKLKPLRIKHIHSTTDLTQVEPHDKNKIYGVALLSNNAVVPLNIDNIYTQDIEDVKQVITRNSLQFIYLLNNGQIKFTGNHTPTKIANIRNATYLYGNNDFLLIVCSDGTIIEHIMDLADIPDQYRA